MNKFAAAFISALALLSNCIYLQTLEDPPELKNLTEEQKVYPTPILDKSALAEDVEKINRELLEKHEGEYIYINQTYIKNKKISDKDDIVLDFINFFHWTTETGIIRQELLFVDKDARITDFELLQESERNLRSTGLFKRAVVYYFDSGGQITDPEAYAAAQKRAEEDGKRLRVVNLGIETRDHNTSTVAFNPSSSGGNTQFHLSAGERNFLGRRYIINTSYTRINTLNKVGQRFGKQRMGGSRWNLTEETSHEYYNGEFIRHSATVVLERPFYSLRTPWSFYLGGLVSEGPIIEFIAGKEATFLASDGNVYSAIQEKEQKVFEAYVARSYSSKSNISTRKRYTFTLGAGQNIEKYNFRDPAADPFAEERLYHDENNHFVQGSFSFQTYNYVKTKNFKRFIFEEDIRLGWDIDLSIRQTAPVFNLPDKYTRFNEQITYSSSHGQGVFPFFYQLSAFNSNRYEYTADVWENNVTSFSAALFWGFSPVGYFANKGLYAMGSNLFNQSVFINEGLDIRGLGSGTMRGNRKMILHNEFRSRPVKLYYFALGFVIFNDWGDVWQTGSAVPFKLKSTVGAGLRVAPIDIQNNIFRLDVGIPITGEEVDPNTIFSFGLEHTF